MMIGYFGIARHFLSFFSCFLLNFFFIFRLFLFFVSFNFFYFFLFLKFGPFLSSVFIFAVFFYLFPSFHIFSFIWVYLFLFLRLSKNPIKCRNWSTAKPIRSLFRFTRKSHTHTVTSWKWILSTYRSSARFDGFPLDSWLPIKCLDRTLFWMLTIHAIRCQILKMWCFASATDRVQCEISSGKTCVMKLFECAAVSPIKKMVHQICINNKLKSHPS